MLGKTFHDNYEHTVEFLLPNLQGILDDSNAGILEHKQ